MIPNSNTARPWRALAGAAALAASLSAPASHAADPFEMEWRELAQGVWVGVRPVSYRSPVMTNTTVVIGDKGVLVFDAAGLAIQGERLVEKVAELTDKPITHIAISHWHGDHSMGDYEVLEKFPAAEVISHEFTARYNASPNGEKVEPRDVKGEAEYRAKVEKALATGVRSDGTPVTPQWRALYVEMLEHYDFLNEEGARRQVTAPTRTMTDRLVIDLGGREAELRHIAPGNTKGDMFLWLPAERILATGDIVVRPTPYGFYSYPRSWAKVLRELKSYDAKYIVPGHGDVMTDTAYLDLLAETMDLVANQVDAAVKAGKTLEETQRRNGLDVRRKALHRRRRDTRLPVQPLVQDADRRGAVQPVERQGQRVARGAGNPEKLAGARPSVRLPPVQPGG